MAAPTTLLECAQQQHTACGQQKTVAQTRLSQAQQRVGATQAAHAQATAAFATLEQEVASIREQLAKIVTPADGEALLEKLELAIIALRASQAALLSAEEDKRAAQDELDQATVALRLAETALASVTAVLEETVSRDKQRNDARSAVTKAPLSTLPATAATELTGAVFTAARTRIEGDIPAALITRARERRDAQGKSLSALRTTVSDAEDAANSEANTNGGAAGKIEAPRSDFLRKEALLFDYVSRGKERYDRALALLTRIADPKKPQLTDAQKARINDATLQTAREAAATKEHEHDAARNAVAEKQAALEVALLKARAADLDADANLDADVIAAQAALAIAKTDLAAAEAAYTAAMKTTLNTWEAAVPDSAWHDLANFEEARELLTTLKDITPGALGTALTAAEQALVTALVVADKRDRTARFLQEHQAQQAAKWTNAQSLTAQRLFSALRGDE
jgi:hypothetical protein